MSSSLAGPELVLACDVLQDRYKNCIQRTVTSSSSPSDAKEAIERNCGYIWASLTSEQCAAVIRRGDLAPAAKKPAQK